MSSLKVGIQLTQNPEKYKYLLSVLFIAQRLSFRPNFINYAFKDDMISDGIENCLQYVNNFNPEKSTNPFAYFTQIIYWAFVRRIQKEKKNLYIKYKEMDRLSYLEDHIDSGPDDSKEYLNLISKVGKINSYLSFFVCPKFS